MFVKKKHPDTNTEPTETTEEEGYCPDFSYRTVLDALDKTLEKTKEATSCAKRLTAKIKEHTPLPPKKTRVA